MLTLNYLCHFYIGDNDELNEVYQCPNCGECYDIDSVDQCVTCGSTDDIVNLR